VRRFDLANGVRVASLGDEVVVFNPFTWETHLLNPAAALVFERVREGGCTRTAAYEVLAEALERSEAALAGEYADRMLRDFASLGLIVECRTA
jgi:PqqD family protein of HPr-rel-A system